MSFLNIFMKDISISSWNVREANGAIARSNVRKLVTESKSNILFFQETRCSVWSNQLMDSIWDSNLYDWEAVNSRGNSGGLLISWKKQVFNIVHVEKSHHWLWCKIKIHAGQMINLINIYGPHEHDEKVIFWETLSKIISSVNLEPMCLI